MTEQQSFYPPTQAPNLGSDGMVTFDDVQERLVEAWGFLRRLPDREGAWLRSGRVSSIWQRFRLSAREAWALYRVDSDDYHRDALPRLPGLRAREVDRMEEALAWIEWVAERDRKLVACVLAQLDRGAATPSWQEAAAAIGWRGEPDTLRKRYGRALARIADRVSRNVPVPSAA